MTIKSQITNDPEVKRPAQEYWNAKVLRDDFYITIMTDYDRDAEAALQAVKEAVAQLGGWDRDGVKAYEENVCSYKYPYLTVERFLTDADLETIEILADENGLKKLLKDKHIDQETFEKCREVAKTTTRFQCKMPKENGE